MFKKALLTLTAVSAVSLLPSSMVTTAEGGIIGHRIKAPPKVRIRTVRPTIRVRVKTKRLVNKRAKRRRICRSYTMRRCPKAPAKAIAKRKVRSTAKAKLATYNRDKLSTAPEGPSPGSRGNSGFPSFVASKAGQSGNRPYTASGYPSFQNPSPAFLADVARYSELGQIASLAQDLKTLSETLRIAGHGSGDLQMFGVEGPQANTDDNNAFDGSGRWERPSGIGGGSAFAPGLGGEGVGSDILFGMIAGYTPTGPQNAKHEGTASAARDNVGVTESHIDAAISGTTSTTTTYHRAGNVVVRKDVEENGIVTHTKVEAITRASDPDDAIGTIVTHYDDLTAIGEGTDSYGHVQTEHGEARRITPVQPAETTELHNPDFAGGSTCQNISCIIGGEKPKGLTPKEVANGASPGGLPPGPDHAELGSSNNGKPIVSQHDLVAKYDTDSQDGNGGGGSTKNDNLGSPGPLPPGPDQ